MSESAAYGFPGAVGEDLDLCFDLLGWFFLFDDQFDARDGRTGDALAVCQELVDSLRSGSPGGGRPAPVVAAFTDCWQRMSRGMSDQWRRRTVHDWVDYLAGWPTKIADRMHGVLPDPASHLRARRRTIGARPLLAVAERVGHFEVPLLVWCSSHVERMRIATCDVIIAMNEIHSLEKDQAGGHPNLVSRLMCHRGHSQAEAVRQVCGEVRLSVESFLELRSGLPHLAQVLGGGAPELHRYADAQASWIRGYHDWGRTAPRYTTRGHPGDLGLENLVVRKPS
ncbi:hypothetical protein GCM10010339_66340 [Streptomyces alanosinicus]|uniref:Terpene synthase n=1 Tax=Streptomyces alanosinicus TaxID=68171 RepID=A0A918YP71_9ACTN|nr:hypothetical protein GCM10010339_66340 [Streptomyces alanosinicus]